MKRRDFMFYGAASGLLLPQLASAAAPSPLATQAADTAGPQALLELDRSWGRAEQQGDIAALENLLDSNFILVDFDGATYNKAQYLDSLRKTKFLSYSISKQDVRQWGETGLVTGEWRAKWVLGDQQDEGTLRFTAVFSRHEGRWRAVAESVAKLAG